MSLEGRVLVFFCGICTGPNLCGSSGIRKSESSRRSGSWECRLEVGTRVACELLDLVSSRSDLPPTEEEVTKPVML